MKTEACQRALWCALFACTAIGPYTLGTPESAEAFVNSGTYAFVALGTLVGMWITSHPAAAIQCKDPRIWKTCLYTGLLLVIGLKILNVLGFAGLATPSKICETTAAFAASCLCGITSVRFGNTPASEPPATRDAAIRCLVVAGAFIAGLLRSLSWEALFTSLWGILLLWGCLFEWCLCMARCHAIRGCVVALCLGELAYRTAGRLGLSLPAAGYGPEDLALLVSALCLLAGTIASLRMPHHGTRKADAKKPHATSLAPWEMEQLEQAGLTQRELDILTASLDGHGSLETAKLLELQPSTVRTYKGRICKKLGASSFDLVLSELSAKKGRFEPPAGHTPATTAAPDMAGKRPAPSALCRFAGCLALIMLLLMPLGRLPVFWNATWTMAYACAAGILASCIPAVLARTGLIRPTGPIGSKILSAAFLVCAIGCCVIRLSIELGTAGFTPRQQIALFFAVAGLVCFGLLELSQCAPGVNVLGSACAYAAVCVLAAACVAYLWYTALALSLILFVLGAALQKRGKNEMGNIRDSHPAVTISWLVVAFIWEECWRGVRYTSLQDIGIPFLLILIVLDMAALLSKKARHSVPQMVVLACAALLCLNKGCAFGLLVGAVLLEIQAQSTHACKDNAAPVPSLLGVAVGCCVAVYVANARGTYMSMPITGLDWPALCCFTFSLAAALCRIPLIPQVPTSRTLNVDQVRLEGYLTGKGLTDDEVRVCSALARGKSSAQISEALSYSTSTVNAMKRSAFAKLGVENRYQYLATLRREFDSK